MSLHFELQCSYAFPKYCKLCKCLSASRKGAAVSLQGERSQEFSFFFFLLERFWPFSGSLCAMQYSTSESTGIYCIFKIKITGEDNEAQHG